MAERGETAGMEGGKVSDENVYDRPITHHGGAKYLRTIHPADGQGEPIKVDVYSVIISFGVTCPGRQQAIKKLLCAGLRGKGSQIEDLQGAMDALWRAMELQRQKEKEEATP